MLFHAETYIEAGCIVCIYASSWYCILQNAVETFYFTRGATITLSRRSELYTMSIRKSQLTVARKAQYS